MREGDCNFGDQNGHVPFDFEYGSVAGNEAMHGLYGAMDEDARKRRKMYQNAAKIPPLLSNQSYSGNGALLVLFMVIVGIYYGFSALFSFTEDWREYSHPYKFIALLYYGLVGLPISEFGRIWSYVIHELFKGYSLLSVIVALTIEDLYLLALLMAFAVLVKAFGRLRIPLLSLLAPAAFTLTWFLGARYL